MRPGPRPEAQRRDLPRVPAPVCRWGTALLPDLTSAPPPSDPACFGEWRQWVEHGRRRLPLAAGLLTNNMHDLHLIPPTPWPMVPVVGGCDDFLGTEDTKGCKCCLLESILMAGKMLVPWGRRGGDPRAE